MRVCDSVSFGNDAVPNFVTELQDFSVIRNTLESVSENSEMLGADSASIALAVCDYLKDLRGEGTTLNERGLTVLPSKAERERGSEYKASDEKITLKTFTTTCLVQNDRQQPIKS